MLDKMLRMGALFDVHSPLLTERQKEMCVLYYFNDYSLAEISELYGVSRQAVHDALTRAERAMEDHEKAFGLVMKAEKRQVRLNQLDSKLSEACLRLENAMASLGEAVRCGCRQDACELSDACEGIQQAWEIIGSARQLVAAVDSGDDSLCDREKEDDDRRGKA
ncbi:MAG: YlxM family DNA-binding protein [Firmicutes bacterium]|nr:YlxM family DNA-binding protein [Bacillota bacterium]MDD4336262.1 YlxM family DNA-binding protein [Bacillota bacterium]MDD4791651.1 YlxM family DNA-binding protein [Bacillota bacterium]